MYNYFARHYDELTDNIDYESRAKYIASFFDKYGIKSGSSLIDLACGTGTMSILFSNMGYNVIGVDSSADMLSVADFKARGKILFINAQMQNYVSSVQADACMCNLDSINHLKNIAEVEKTFRSVYNSLKTGGIFVFDVNTVYKHNFVLADNSFVFDEDGYFLSWDNEPLDDNTVRILLDFFVYNGKSYDRYSEEFTEKAYETEVLISALEPYFEVSGIYDDVSLNPPSETSERIYFVCKRK